MGFVVAMSEKCQKTTVLRVVMIGQCERGLPYGFGAGTAGGGAGCHT